MTRRPQLSVTPQGLTPATRPTTDGEVDDAAKAGEL